MSKTALIIGATGLTGEHCLMELLASPEYDKIIALTRTRLQTTNSEIQNIITDFKNLENLRPQLRADHVYCCMGTTIAKAGSQAAFRHVDYEIPLQVAEIAR